MLRIRKSVSTRLTGLVFFIGLYLMGIGYGLSLWDHTSLNSTLFWNRFYLYALTGLILLGIYAWISFKPKNLATEQYTFHPWSREDIPDSLRGVPQWGSGRLAKKNNKNDELDEPSRDYWMEQREEHRKEEE